ncbi:uncharacterized [Tachysurus ichikawai]
MPAAPSMLNLKAHFFPYQKHPSSGENWLRKRANEENACGKEEQIKISREVKMTLVEVQLQEEYLEGQKELMELAQATVDRIMEMEKRASQEQGMDV